MKRMQTLDRGSLPAQPNQSLIDGLACLSALAVHREGVGSRQLARELGLNVMRVNRLLKTLAATKLARQLPDRRYTAGAAMHVLSVQSLFSSNLLRRTLDAVPRLPHQTHGVALGVLWQDRVCYLFHAPPGTDPASAIGRHALFPAFESSIGLALLSHEPLARVRKLFSAQASTSNQTWPRLRDTLTRARRQGWAWVVQNGKRPSGSLAVPVGEPPYAALALTGVLSASERDAVLPAMRQVAAQIDHAEKSAIAPAQAGDD
jgi:DNA-binding IclR family transcriptional regulator